MTALPSTCLPPWAGKHHRFGVGYLRTSSLATATSLQLKPRALGQQILRCCSPESGRTLEMRQLAYLTSSETLIARSIAAIVSRSHAPIRRLNRSRGTVSRLSKFATQRTGRPC